MSFFVIAGGGAVVRPGDHGHRRRLPGRRVSSSPRTARSSTDGRSSRLLEEAERGARSCSLEGHQAGRRTSGAGRASTRRLRNAMRDLEEGGGLLPRCRLARDPSELRRRHAHRLRAGRPSTRAVASSCSWSTRPSPPGTEQWVINGRAAGGERRLSWPAFASRVDAVSIAVPWDEGGEQGAVASPRAAASCTSARPAAWSRAAFAPYSDAEPEERAPEARR